ncbi:MAG TPA: DUF5668 domain-containing protein [Nitrolancea sp.]|nr:DUF5668 domain-containing protein [Nitrolancea sp.]
MHTAQRFNPGRLLVGLLLLAVGSILLLDRAGWGDAGHLIGQWWPLIIVAAGLIQIAVANRPAPGPVLLVLFGLVLLPFTLDLISASFWSVFWPLVLILVGLAFIFRQGLWPRARTSASDDVSAFAIFSPSTVVSHAAALQGGTATAIFGGVTLDLRQARLAPGAAIDASAAFGGIDVLVPPGWRVEMRGLPIFGGLSDKTRHEGPLPDDAPALTVNGLAFFGGVDVKNEK